MPRYKRRPTYEETSPGLFDAFDNEKPEIQSDGKTPTIVERASRVKASGGIAPIPTESTDSFIEPIEAPTPQTTMRFISFGSGSSGNCAYIGDEKSGFLIDAGVDSQRVVAELKHLGIKMDSVKGVILTHDHGDHVRYVYKLLRKHTHMLLYCTPIALSGRLRRLNLSRRIKDYHKPIYKEFPFTIGNFSITAFDVSHDGTDNSGFFIELGEHKFAIATDLGFIGERADHYMKQARYIMIESNYDNDMLVNGQYAEYLKARILSETGHMDNLDTAQYLASIASPALSHVFLCHLSNDNNTPEKATEAVINTLKDKGLSIGNATDDIQSRDADIQVMPLPRYESTRLFTFR